MTTPWTGEVLYKRYGLTKNEIAFIESKIRPMAANGE
jgi:site-specific DNA-methyltransferase (adenine-specific)